MSLNSKIEWCHATWSPVTGCTPVSAGCTHCYARRMANRLRGRYGYPQDDPFKVTLHPDRLDQPLHWRKPRMIFVPSMGDFFHPRVPISFQTRMLYTMVNCPQHIFVILTKRHEQLSMFNDVCGWSAESYSNIWLGVSVENQKTADERIPILLQVPAAKRIVSVEPMLGAVDLNVYQYSKQSRDGPRFLDWVICGGETGPGARPMHPDWARSLRDQCIGADVPFFFKQTGPWIPDRLADPTEPHVLTVDGLRMSLTSKKRHPMAAKLGKHLLDGKVWEQVPKVKDA